ncbi:MAG: acetyl-CoA carboxylase biotin carboxyl carrier protein [Gemmatimonadota bacterium]
MDMEWLRQLIDMVSDSEIDSVEISRLGRRVRVCKSPAVQVVNSAEGLASAGVAHGPFGGGGGATGSPALEAAEGDAPEEPADSSDLFQVNSPMVGTFYRAPAPDAPPYVEVGDRVSKGQTLCILEAMKLMNELESEVSGVVREIAVQNAEPVEYGQLLFRIEPDGAG